MIIYISTFSLWKKNAHFTVLAVQDQSTSTHIHDLTFTLQYVNLYNDKYSATPQTHSKDKNKTHTMIFDLQKNINAFSFLKKNEHSTVLTS